MTNEKIIRLSLSIKQCPRNYKFYKKRAYCYLNQNNFKSALFDFIKAFNLRKTDRQVNYGLIFCYFKCGFYEKALLQINRINLNKQPLYISFNGKKIPFKSKLKQIKSSCFIKLKKNSGIMKQKIKNAKQYIELKKYKKAALSLGFILDIEPKNFDVIMNLAYACRHMGAERLAVKYLSKAKKLYPKNKKIIKELALTHVQAGDSKKALNELKCVKNKKTLTHDLEKMIDCLTG